MKVIGYEDGSFVSERTGDAVAGTNVFVQVKDEKYGQRCERFFVPEGRLPEPLPAVGSEVMPVFNSYGKVESVRAL